MYRETIAKQMFEGRDIAELTAEEVTALDEAIPFILNEDEAEEETTPTAE
jgi:hypothetical protein